MIRTAVHLVKGLLSVHQVEKRFHFSEDTYPPLPFGITVGEIAALKEQGVVDRGQQASH